MIGGDPDRMGAALDGTGVIHRPSTTARRGPARAPGPGADARALPHDRWPTSSPPPTSSAGARRSSRPCTSPSPAAGTASVGPCSRRCPACWRARSPSASTSPTRGEPERIVIPNGIPWDQPDARAGERRARRPTARAGEGHRNRRAGMGRQRPGRRRMAHDDRRRGIRSVSRSRRWSESSGCAASVEMVGAVADVAERLTRCLDVPGRRHRAEPFGSGGGGGHGGRHAGGRRRRRAHLETVGGSWTRSLFSPGDWEARAAALRHLAEIRRERRRVYGDRSRAEYLASFTIERHAERVLEVYRTAVLRPNAPLRPRSGQLSRCYRLARWAPMPPPRLRSATPLHQPSRPRRSGSGRGRVQFVIAFVAAGRPGNAMRDPGRGIVLVVGVRSPIPRVVLAIVLVATMFPQRVGPAALNMSVTDAVGLLALIAALRFVPWTDRRISDGVRRAGDLPGRPRREPGGPPRPTGGVRVGPPGRALRRVHLHRRGDRPVGRHPSGPCASSWWRWACSRRPPASTPCATGLEPAEVFQMQQEPCRPAAGRRVPRRLRRRPAAGVAEPVAVRSCGWSCWSAWPPRSRAPRHSGWWRPSPCARCCWAAGATSAPRRSASWSSCVGLLAVSAISLNSRDLDRTGSAQKFNAINTRTEVI